MKMFLNRYMEIAKLVLMLLMLTSCKEFIEIDRPLDKITPADVFYNDIGAIAVINGIYIDLSLDGRIATGGSSIGYITGLSCDEIALKTTNTNNGWAELYQNNLTSASVPSLNVWSNLYSLLYRTNSAINEISNSSSIANRTKMQLLGEAKFIRGFLYFYLVNLFGDVPLVLGSDITTNSKLPREPIEKVYSQIIEDLIFAKNNLTGDYLNGDLKTISSQRVRPNQVSARALLARCYLFTARWSEAENEANSIIDNQAFILEPLSRVFKKDSKEAIWQIERSSVLQTNDAAFYIPFAGSLEKPYFLSDQLYSTFELGDQRKIQWVYSYTDGTGTFKYPYKYRDYNINNVSQISEYNVIFRLAEQYLIRAEARAMQGRIIGPNSAKNDLDLIRSRAGLSASPALTQQSILDAILKERQVELIGEWGHRWLDLKRVGKIDAVLSVIAPSKGSISSWKPYKALFPIPISEIQKNPTLVGHQNPGY